jgi:hypothetical protein
MRKRKFLIGATLGVLGALVFSASAFAGTPQSQQLQTTLSPKKQSKKTFGGVSLHNIISTTYDNFTASPSPSETKFTIDPNVKFVNGNVPACPASSINSGQSHAQAQAACPQSIVGQGFALVNNGSGLFPHQNPVWLIAGGPTTIYVHTDLLNAAGSSSGIPLLITGQIQGKILDFTGLPDTSGTDLTTFDTTFNKRKTGKKTFYVMARCKTGKWSTTETTNFFHGAPPLSATSSGKCKKKKAKKK